jgi:hypothetical protein
MRKTTANIYRVDEKDPPDPGRESPPERFQVKGAFFFFSC